MNFAWSGHRQLSDPKRARMMVTQEMPMKLSEHQLVIVGGALGADTIVAQVALEWNIPYSLYLPFPVGIFTQKWEPKDRKTLEYLIMNAKTFKVIGKEYDIALYQKRNEAMIDDADEVVALWSGITRGGTWNAIQYTVKRGKPLRILPVH